MYQWPSRRSSLAASTSPNITPLKGPPERPSTTPPTRPPKRSPSYGAVTIHATPPPRSPAQLRATLDPSRIGPTRMPSYVGSLLDAFSIDSLGDTSLDLNRSFEVSPMPSSGATITEESHTSSVEHSPVEVPSVQVEGLQLTLSLPERPFSMGSIAHYPQRSSTRSPTRSPSPPPSRPRTPTARRIRLDSAAFEKPPQSFSVAAPPREGLRRRSCILDCVRKVRRGVRKH